MKLLQYKILVSVHLSWLLVGHETYTNISSQCDPLLAAKIPIELIPVYPWCVLELVLKMGPGKYTSILTTSIDHSTIYVGHFKFRTKLIPIKIFVFYNLY